MNKAELIDQLTERLESDRRSATDAVEHIVDIIVRAVHAGENVTITGFGVFEQRRRAARVARNPRTGETVKVKPTSVPAFRPTDPETSKRPPRRVASSEVLSGDVLLSHNLPVAVPSALKGLTSGFGMEPGVSLSLWPPKLYGVRSTGSSPSLVPDRNSGTTQWTRNIFEGQALGLLVPVGWASLLYTSGLSTQSSAGGLTRLTRWETSS